MGAGSRRGRLASGSTGLNQWICPVKRYCTAKRRHNRMDLMALDGRLLAWIEDNNDREFTAHLVSSDSKESRLPDTLSCRYRLDAQLWIEKEAATLRIPVDWVSPSS